MNLSSAAPMTIASLPSSRVAFLPSNVSETSFCCKLDSAPNSLTVPHPVAAAFVLRRLPYSKCPSFHHHLHSLWVHPVILRPEFLRLLRLPLLQRLLLLPLHRRFER